MKVLYLLNHAGKAGTERYVQSLMEKLNGKKIKAYFAYNEEGLLAERVRELGIESCRIEMRSPYDLKAAKELAALCRKLEIDLVHTHFLRENYIAMLAQLFGSRAKVAYTNHFIMRNNLPTRIANRLMNPLEAGVIAVCNRGREMMISNGVAASKIRVLFNAVDPGLWGTPEPSTLRSEFDISGDMFVLLCASRFAHDKGHRYLVRTMAKLKEMGASRFKCVLAGDGPLLEEIRQLTAELGLEQDIAFVGFRKDIKNLFNGSDLYFNSSEHEASSFLILEALASGLPVAATDMGGNNDIINEKTGCGVLVKYEDAEGTAREIKRIMDDPGLQEKLKQNALKAVEENFNLVKMAEETYNLYVEFTKNRFK
jgi:glycosyltransferase involved in cell wall biosynthesis